MRKAIDQTARASKDYLKRKHSYTLDLLTTWGVGLSAFYLATGLMILVPILQVIPFILFPVSIAILASAIWFSLARGNLEKPKPEKPALSTETKAAIMAAALSEQSTPVI